MYLRRTTRRVGDKTYQNYLLVESVATPKGPRQRVICSLGAMAPADEVLKSLSRTRRPLYQAPSISRVGAPKFALPQRSARLELVVS